MPRIFPGMDPYIEGQAWEDFHNRLQNALAQALAPVLRPRYVARLEKRVYVELPPDDSSSIAIPELAVVRTPRGEREAAPHSAPAGATRCRCASRPPVGVRERLRGRRLRLLARLSPRGHATPGASGCGLGCEADRGCPAFLIRAPHSVGRAAPERRLTRRVSGLSYSQ